jgi:hypothetical protein
MNRNLFLLKQDITHKEATHKEPTHKEAKVNKMKTLILGKTFHEALKLYSNLRIVKDDDKCSIVTLNFCEDRCNVVIKNNIITEIDGFY